jgi:hypothetical protein
VAIILLSLWWKDVIKGGLLQIIIAKSAKELIVCYVSFIVSEIMFFLTLFWAFFSCGDINFILNHFLPLLTTGLCFFIANFIINYFQGIMLKSIPYLSKKLTISFLFNNKNEIKPFFFHLFTFILTNRYISMTISIAALNILFYSFGLLTFFWLDVFKFELIYLSRIFLLFTTYCLFMENSAIFILTLLHSNNEFYEVILNS